MSIKWVERERVAVETIKGVNMRKIQSSHRTTERQVQNAIEKDWGTIRKAWFKDKWTVKRTCSER